ncbi:MAG: PTS sugar transporter subunit IIA [Thermoguttaceae bacterium]
MDLSVRDSAQLLKVSEKTIYRWVKQGKLPAYRIHEQYRFNRAELLEWATSQRLNVSADIFAEPDGGGHVVTLTDALRTGGVHYRLGGSDKPAALKALVDVMPLPDEVDRQFLYQVLLARESLGSTALGSGIAVPHVRNPIVMHIVRPMITLCFLEQPIEFGALDGQPVHTLFTIVSPTVRAHLHLLSRLGFALRQPVFMEAIAEQRSREQIFAASQAVDQSIPPSSPPSPTDPHHHERGDQPQPPAVA